MKYLLSMDGGGSKTVWLLTTVNGDVVAEHTCGGCSHPQMGYQSLLDFFYSNIDMLLKNGGCSKADVISAAFGVPCYGEYADTDEMIVNDLNRYLCNTKIYACNDVELGYAGSLGFASGIHVVAGTGAIVIGKNLQQQTARSNGWHPYFSDEGSGYWLGMKTLGLFSKQADYRAPRSMLYKIMMDELKLKSDCDIAAYYDKFLYGNRKETAAMQLFLQKAADAGDSSAIELYKSAAFELFLSVRSVYNLLFGSGENKIRLSYSGGLFSKGGYILGFLKDYLKELPVVPSAPMFTPVYGGILMAMKNVSDSDGERLLNILKNKFKVEDFYGND